jgi:hypothetical protein
LHPHRSSPKKDQILAARGPGFFTDLREKLERDIRVHYRNAESQGCKDIIWSNEGLYLLNSAEEHERLLSLFTEFSSQIVGICCFRDVESYRASFMEQLKKTGFSFSDDRDSYRYVERDSWLFDYERKRKLLTQVFDATIFFPYEANDMVTIFMEHIGYVATDGDAFRYNVTERVQR